MPYAPDVPDKTSDYIFQGYSQLGQAQQQENLLQARQFEQMQSRLYDVAEKAMLRKEESDMLSGQADTLLPPDQLEKFHSASLGKKRGMINEAQARANLLRQKDLDTFQTNNQMRQDSNQINAQGAATMAVKQLGAGAEAPKYDRVTMPDGTVAFVAPNAPTTFPTDPRTGQPMKAQTNQNPLAALLGGGAADPAQPAGAPPAAPTTPAPRAAMGGYQVGRRYGGMTYLGGDPNDAASWQ